MATSTSAIHYSGRSIPDCLTIRRSHRSQIDRDSFVVSLICFIAFINTFDFIYLINILFCAVPMYTFFRCAYVFILLRCAYVFMLLCCAYVFIFALRLVIQFCAACSLLLDPTLALFVFLSRPNHIIINHPYS